MCFFATNENQPKRKNTYSLFCGSCEAMTIRIIVIVIIIVSMTIYHRNSATNLNVRVYGCSVKDI